MPQTTPYFFIKEGDKLIQCSKTEFDKAIKHGKSVWYRGYANKRAEKIARQLETSRMAFLMNPTLSPKFRETLTNPANVVEVEIMRVDDPLFWDKESKRPKYQV